ncbi:MAG: type I-E CRISPR-associated protein Cas5/CasD [Bacillota bacterium]|nr:type I-E CRISPR-associated protein Cas5/CasD [Bacillota bacterium]
MTIPILLLRLEGPLQSWGERAHWDYRDSSLFPTKSGIIGMLSCALGYRRDDERLSRICDNTRIAIRADKPGLIMTDYHTVQGPNGVIINAEGKRRPGSGTIVTPRQYLQDASFLVNKQLV